MLFSPCLLLVLMCICSVSFLIFNQWFDTCPIQTFRTRILVSSLGHLGFFIMCFLFGPSLFLSHFLFWQLVFVLTSVRLSVYGYVTVIWVSFWVCRFQVLLPEIILYHYCLFLVIAELLFECYLWCLLSHCWGCKCCPVSRWLLFLWGLSLICLISP